MNITIDITGDANDMTAIIDKLREQTEIAIKESSTIDKTPQTEQRQDALKNYVLKYTKNGKKYTVNFLYPFEVRDYVEQFSEEWEDYDISKLCLMDKCKFMQGDSHALVGYKLD